MKAIFFILLFACASAKAAIVGFSELDTEFTNSSSATNVTWSAPKTLSISSNGLGWDGPTNSFQDFWIQSIPVAIGTSWRPAGGANIRIIIAPERSYDGKFFVRYSPDKRNWSSWQGLEGLNGVIDVPGVASQEYFRLLSQYQKMKVPWVSDEEAAVKWILQQQPDFFKTNLPFVGYVQYRMEGSLLGNHRIKKIRMELDWMVSGLQVAPKDSAVEKHREGEWRFEASH